MTTGLHTALTTLGIDLADAACRPETSGFRSCYRGQAGDMPLIAEAFSQHDYLLELLTCVDLRQHEGCMRLVYIFNTLGEPERHRVQVDLAPTQRWTPPREKRSDKPMKRAPATEDSAESGQEVAPQQRPPPLPRAAVSIASIYPAADWYEREVYDMYGVHFEGHPNLKRLLLPDDASFYPLLKDFGRIEDAEIETGDGNG